MKVVESIESTYIEQRVLYEKLQKKVRIAVDTFKPDSWFYISRIKTLQSYALKLETGRFKNVLEDFFACTIVVENLSQITTAIKLIRKEFFFVKQKPQNLLSTHKNAYSFEFDDLRLYVKLKKTPYLENDFLSDLEFEIQVKTFLQYAWGKATHRLIYKSDTISWPSERIAYQVKAMLEQAEVSISGVKDLIKVPEVNKENNITIIQKEILSFYLNFYKKEELPEDLIRLCKNTYELINALQLNISKLKAIIQKENLDGRGTKLKNLSPYLLVLQSIFNQESDLLERYINSSENRKIKILIPKEIDLKELKIRNEENVIRI